MKGILTCGDKAVSQPVLLEGDALVEPDIRQFEFAEQALLLLLPVLMFTLVIPQLVQRALQ